MSKIKYILHGGKASRDTENNTKFVTEITKDLPKDSSILIVLFAKPKETWNEKFEAIKNTFSKIVPQKNINLEIAHENSEKFIEQIKKADALYLIGGDSHILKEYLLKIPNLVDLWQDKIIAGSSAGAVVLGKYFYENDDDTYNKGLNILPFKIITHYSKDNDDKLRKLKSFGEDIQTLAIPEEQFIIINN